MTKSAAWRAAIAAATLALALSTSSPAVRAWAEEPPPTTATSEEPAVPPEASVDPTPATPSETPTPAEPSPAEEPVPEAPATDPLAPEPTETAAEPAPAAPVAAPEADVAAPVFQENPTTNRWTAPQNPRARSTPAEEPTGLSSSDLSALGIAAPAVAPLLVPPEAAATPKATAPPTSAAVLEQVDYSSSAAVSNSSPLAVIALVGSLGLAVLLSVGNIFYRTRIANRLRPRAFPRR